jgi:hypothetical protein
VTDGQGRQQELVGTGGEDLFRTWLAVQRNNSQTVIALNYADWKVNYTTTVTNFNNQAPQNSTLRIHGHSGPRITKRGDGFGWWRRPILNDPVANQVQVTRTATW